MAEARVRSRLFRRRWGYEVRLQLLAILSCWVLISWFGRNTGELVFSLAILLGVCASPKLRREVPTRLLHRQRLRRTQKRLDLALGADSPIMVERALSSVGETITCSLLLGSSVPAITKAAPVIATALGAREVRVRSKPESAGLVDLVVVWHESLEEPVPPNMLWAQPTDVYDHLPLGIDEDGREVAIGLVGRHLLIGGETGAGKSGTLSVVLAGAALDPGCDIWCFDGKQVELAAWEPVARRVIGPDMGEANEALDELRAEMDERYAGLKAEGRRKVEKADGTRPIVVVIDELAFYVSNGDKKAAQGFSERLRDLVARARAAGIAVVAATQKPSADLIPTALRDNFGYRLAHRCATRDASDTILGSGWATEGISSSSIDPGLRGVGYLLAEGGVPRRMRAVYLDDEAIATVVSYAELERRNR